MKGDALDPITVMNFIMSMDQQTKLDHVRRVRAYTCTNKRPFYSAHGSM